MIRNKWTHNRTIVLTLGITSAAVWSLDAKAAGYSPAHTLPWPLFESKLDAQGVQVGGPSSSNPRPAVGNTVGEFQKYDPVFVHSGADVRGVVGDPVYVVKGGNVWFRANFSENTQDCASGYSCRLYIKGDDGYIFYYSHLRLDKTAPEYSVSLKDAILNANARDPSTGTYPVQSNTRVEANQLLTAIADFTGWNHLHFGIIDGNDGFKVIDPLTALAQSAAGPNGNVPIADDERPTVASLRFVADGTSPPVEVVPSGNCREVSGRLDIAAQMRDSFYSRGSVPTGLTGDYSSIGVASANYVVRRARTAELIQQGTWDSFDRFPFCGGDTPACPQNLSEAEFVALSINTDKGAIEPGHDYTNKLFWTEESCSGYQLAGEPNAPWNPGTGDCVGERYIHLLTNGYGIDGAWNTDDPALPTGRYEVTAEAADANGNLAALSTFVTVNHGGDLSSIADAYVRDNSVERGNLPSTAGKLPFWISPDIVVTLAGTTAPISPESAGQVRIVADQTYDVYVFVHNDTCVDLSGVRVEVFSANPALIQNEADWAYVTSGYEGEPGSPVGISVPQLQVTRMGPYSWTPTATEAAQNNGHRCMLARIDSPADPIQKSVNQVSEDNNIAQLNMQIDATSFDFIGSDSGVGLDFDCGNFPAGEPQAQVVLQLEAGSFADAITSAWQNKPGATVTSSSGIVSVSYSLCFVSLPAVPVPSNTLLSGEVQLVLPAEHYGTFSVTLAETINNVQMGGQAFSVTRDEDPAIR